MRAEMEQDPPFLSQGDSDEGRATWPREESLRDIFLFVPLFKNYGYISLDAMRIKWPLSQWLNLRSVLFTHAPPPPSLLNSQREKAAFLSFLNFSSFIY